MGILFAIVATTRFVAFVTMDELFGAHNPELSCMVPLGVDMPFWERQVAEIQTSIMGIGCCMVRCVLC